MEQVRSTLSILPNEMMRELVLRLVWGAGGPKDVDNGGVIGRRFLRRPFPSLLKSDEVFPRWGSMVL